MTAPPFGRHRPIYFGPNAMASPPDPDAALRHLMAPLDRRAMGAAVGLASALALFAITAVPLLRGSVEQLPLVLLAQYFYGYTPSWPGALIGAAWAGLYGFGLGWFLALCRNAMLSLRLIQLRARAEYAKTRDFMDHI